MHLIVISATKKELSASFSSAQSKVYWEWSIDLLLVWPTKQISECYLNGRSQNILLMFDKQIYNSACSLHMAHLAELRFFHCDATNYLTMIWEQHEQYSCIHIKQWTVIVWCLLMQMQARITSTKYIMTMWTKFIT